jgi:hypothetical protein
VTDRPQYPSYPGDDDAPAAPAGTEPLPGYGQMPPAYGQPAIPGHGQAPPPAYGQVPPPGYGYGYPPPQASTNGKAVAGLVLGIVSIVFCYLGVLIGVAGIILSVMAGREINSQPPGAVPGKGMATAGLVTSIIGTVIWGAVVVLMIIGFSLDA